MSTDLRSESGKYEPSYVADFLAKSGQLKAILKWLQRSIKTKVGLTPRRCKLFDYPTFIWISFNWRKHW